MVREGEASSKAGEQALTLLSTPLNLHVLRALSERPMRLAELRQATGLPAQTTLRGHLETLIRIGALERRPTRRMPYAVESELTPMGEDLLCVADRLDVWLRGRPEGPISLDSGAAKGVVKALVDGWGSTIMSGLAVRPMSLTELDREIPDLSYPALERRLSSMRMAGLVCAEESKRSGTPYGVTPWARLGIAPLAAAGRCERIHAPNASVPITYHDIEAAFLLSTPLIGLPEESDGLCQLLIEDDSDSEGGVDLLVEVQAGKVVACGPAQSRESASLVAGSTAGWLSALDGGGLGQLRFGGGRGLAEALVLGLRAAFAVPAD